MLIYIPSWRHRRVYIYSTKWICCSSFGSLFLSLSIAHACPKEPLSLCSHIHEVFLSLTQPVLPDSPLPSPGLSYTSRLSLSRVLLSPLAYSTARQRVLQLPQGLVLYKRHSAQLLLTTILHQDESQPKPVPGRPGGTMPGPWGLHTQSPSCEEFWKLWLTAMPGPWVFHTQSPSCVEFWKLWLTAVTGKSMGLHTVSYPWIDSSILWCKWGKKMNLELCVNSGLLLFL